MQQSGACVGTELGDTVGVDRVAERAVLALQARDGKDAAPLLVSHRLGDGCVALDGVGVRQPNRTWVSILMKWRLTWQIGTTLKSFRRQRRRGSFAASVRWRCRTG